MAFVHEVQDVPLAAKLLDVDLVIYRTSQGITVARDPGLWLKYLGTAMLGLGLCVMFYMRAYFQKPREAGSLAGRVAGASPAATVFDSKETPECSTVS